MKQNLVKQGRQTSEYEQTQKNSRWSIVGICLGGVIGIGGLVLEGLGGSSTAAIIVGGIVSAAGMAQGTLVNLGYIQSRTEIKQAASFEETD